MPILEPVVTQFPVNALPQVEYNWPGVRNVDRNTFDSVALQWKQRPQKKLFRSSMTGSDAIPIDTRYWKYLEPIPLPNI
jgi:hypothetical protein